MHLRPLLLAIASLALPLTGLSQDSHPEAELTAPQTATQAPALAAPDFCANLPRPGNAGLRTVPVITDWFEVYEVSDGVYALVEPYQYQETISYLITGTERALLFDTGLGLVRLRPVVEQLTRLPVDVINSHTHYDHVGGNFEFDSILALDTPFTRANMAGFPAENLSTEVASEAFCKEPPVSDKESFHTRPWQATRFISDGEVLDLGGRKIQILQVPGHTPDALALFDQANRLMWSGDSYYDGGIWLFAAETDLDAYEQSLARLVALLPGVDWLLPAHNVARISPEKLAAVPAALQKVRSGNLTGTQEEWNTLVFEVDGVTIVTAQPILDGFKGDTSRGGYGFTEW
jgi:glyoxylase-like metal-dependent hydrolase (beta-lactamase superfamily II)